MSAVRALAFTSKGGQPVNEDTVKLIQYGDGGLVAIVADGLGSHGGGDIASAAAIEAIAGALPQEGPAGPESLARCLEAANAAVLSRQRPGLAMKSTAVILAAEHQRLTFAHLGDSRGYYFRGGRIAHQTMDHSVSQMAVLSGQITAAQIRFHESRNKLLRALGGDEKTRPEITTVGAPDPGDAALLCSDGFWEYVTETEMVVDLAKSADAKTWLSFMLARIGSRMAKNHDNLSAIVIVWEV